MSAASGKVTKTSIQNSAWARRCTFAAGPHIAHEALITNTDRPHAPTQNPVRRRHTLRGRHTPQIASGQSGLGTPGYCIVKFWITAADPSRMACSLKCEENIFAAWHARDPIKDRCGRGSSATMRFAYQVSSTSCRNHKSDCLIRGYVFVQILPMSYAPAWYGVVSSAGEAASGLHAWCIGDGAADDLDHRIDRCRFHSGAGGQHDHTLATTVVLGSSNPACG